MRVRILLCFLLSMAAASCTGGGGGGGSSCGSNADCGDTEYCNFIDNTCGLEGASGNCEEIPASCTDEVSTVCSCDRLTFFNSCYAAQAAQSIQSQGECA